MCDHEAAAVGGGVIARQTCCEMRGAAPSSRRSRRRFDRFRPAVQSLLAALVWSALAGGALAYPAQASASGLNDVDDVLGGQRVLANVVDLVITDPAPEGSATVVQEVFLSTSDGAIVDQSA